MCIRDRSSIVENFPALKELNLSFNFAKDARTDAFQDFVDPDFKVKIPEADKTTITISLQSELDQEKQLRIFGTMKHLKRLVIHGLNRAGATYLNSIAKDLPRDISVEVDFESDKERIDLLAPIKETDSPFFP